MRRFAAPGPEMGGESKLRAPVAKIQDATQEIYSCHKMNRWSEALQVFSSLHEQHLKADPVCYRAIMHACGQAKQWQHAVWLFSQLRELEIPDAATYRIVSRPARLSRRLRMRSWTPLTTPRVGGTSFRTLCGSGSSPLEPFRARFDPLRVAFGLAFEALAEDVEDVLDLHDHSRGSALLLLHHWLATAGPRRTVITGWGKSRRDAEAAPVRSAVLRRLAELGIPAEAPRRPTVLFIKPKRPRYVDREVRLSI